MDDEAMKEKLEGAMEDMHPEAAPENDPFKTDALGNKPAEEDDMGSLE